MLVVGDALDASNRSRRALALLALAAAAGPDGIDRPAVLALLWPDSDSDRAANSFRQIVHGIRRDLGEGAIVYENGALRLNSELFSVDLWDFERAIRSDDLETAAALYRGSFLGSFSISGLVELERWVETQRERLKQTALASLHMLATRARSHGQHHDHIKWWRRIVEIDPLSSRNAFGLLEALVDAGERAGALDFARTYEALVRAELETDVDEKVGQYVATLRRATTPTAVIPAAEPPQIPPSASVIAATEADNQDSSIDDSLYKKGHSTKDRYAHEAPRVEPRGRVGWRALTSRPAANRLAAVTGGLILVTGVATASRLSNAAGAAEAAASNVVAVLPFHTYDTADSTLGATLAALLSADLDGAGSLRSVGASSVAAMIGKMNLAHGGAALETGDAVRVAKRVGAAIFVTGDVLPRVDGVRLSLTLRDAHSGAVIGRPLVIDTDASHAKAVVDEVAGTLVAERYRRPTDQLLRAALRSTRSVAALKAYLRGDAAFRDARFVDAVTEFGDATAADSQFAVAYYRLAAAADWAGRELESRRATEMAIRFSDHLENRERRLIVAYAATRDGRSTIAELGFRSILDDYPNDAEAWFQLGEVLFHDNPLHGKSATLARPAFERLLALAPDNVEAIIHLARIASLEHRHSDAAAFKRRALKLVDAPGTLEQRAFRAFALADRPGLRRVTRDLERVAPTDVEATSLLGMAIEVDDVFGTERFARELIKESSSSTSRAFGSRLLAYAWVAQGRWREAFAQLDSAVVLDRDLGIAELSLVATMPFVPMTRPQLVSVQELVQSWIPSANAPVDNETFPDNSGTLVRQYRLGLLSVRLGDIPTALEIAAQLESVMSTARARRYANTMAQSLRAHVSAEQGHFTEALAMLDGADWESVSHVFAAEAGDRFFRAGLLEKLNRSTEATGWYESIAQRAVYELPYLAPSQARLAGIKRAAGDATSAKIHADRLAQLWHNAESSGRVDFP